MHNDIILECLEIIAEALELVAKRFGEIDNPEEFILSDYNLTLIDAISMRYLSFFHLLTLKRSTA